MTAVSFKLFKRTLYCVLLLVLHLQAQSQELRFKRINSQNGLSQSNVTSILKDKKGFLWMATRDGLNRYDGYTMTVYRNNQSDNSTISSNYVSKVYEDRQGNIWVGGTDGLDRYDRKRDSFVHYKLSKSIVFVKTIIEDSKGLICIGAKKGFYILNPKTLKVESFFTEGKGNTILDNDVNVLNEVIKGEIWIGTQRGLSIYNVQNKRFDNYQHSRKNALNLSHGGQVTIVVISRVACLW